MEETREIIILYDGNCPICQRKVAFLKRRDSKNRLKYTDINDPQSIPADVTVDPEILQRQIHARLPNGQILEGMDVLRAAYGAIGIGWIIAPTKWPVLRPLFDFLYNLLARNRQHVSSLLRLDKNNTD